jgi:amino acid permease
LYFPPSLLFFRFEPHFLTSQGFAGGWFYCFGYAVDFPNKAVVFANYMSFWSDKPRVLWISIFFVFPIGFNILNVRRYGEVEYWFTAIKVVTIVGLSLAGLLIAMDATGTVLLGTDANLRPVPCAENVIGECLGGPGFGCISLPHSP